MTKRDFQKVNRLVSELQVAISELSRKIDDGSDQQMSSDLIHVARDELNACETVIAVVQDMERSGVS